jgi:hypothetical protein
VQLLRIIGLGFCQVKGMLFSEQQAGRQHNEQQPPDQEGQLQASNFRKHVVPAAQDPQKLTDIHALL